MDTAGCIFRLGRELAGELVFSNIFTHSFYYPSSIIMASGRMLKEAAGLSDHQPSFLYPPGSLYLHRVWGLFPYNQIPH